MTNTKNTSRKDIIKNCNAVIEELGKMCFKKPNTKPTMTEELYEVFDEWYAGAGKKVIDKEAGWLINQILKWHEKHSRKKVEEVCNKVIDSFVINERATYEGMVFSEVLDFDKTDIIKNHLRKELKAKLKAAK